MTGVDRAKIGQGGSMAESPLVKPSRTVTAILSLILAILMVWFLRETYFLTMPLAMGFFLAVLVRPAHAWLLDHLHSRLKWLAMPASAALVVLAVAAGAAMVYIAIIMVADEAPAYAAKFQQYWQAFAAWGQRHDLPISRSMLHTEGIRSRLLAVATTIVSSLWNWLGLLAFTFFYLILMLLEAKAWQEKAAGAFNGAQSAALLDTVRTVSTKMRQFMLVQTGVSLFSAVVNGLALWALGIDFAFVWAMLFFVLNYIPNIGSFIAAVPAVLVAFLQHGVTWGLLTAGVLLVLEQVTGNLLAPRLQGRSLRVSSLVLLFSVIFWGWVWGAAGAVLAVPITVTLVIVCAHVPSLKPLARMLSQGPDLHEQLWSDDEQEKKSPLRKSS